MQPVNTFTNIKRYECYIAQLVLVTEFCNNLAGFRLIYTQKLKRTKKKNKLTRLETKIKFIKEESLILNPTLDRQINSFISRHHTIHYFKANTATSLNPKTFNRFFFCATTSTTTQCNLVSFLSAFVMSKCCKFVNCRPSII